MAALFQAKHQIGRWPNIVSIISIRVESSFAPTGSILHLIPTRLRSLTTDNFQ
jgi:hypothetical protein